MSEADYDGARVVAAARAWIGTPYVHRASVKGAGADCIGLVRGVWRELIGAEPEPLPAYSAHWAECGVGERLQEALTRHMRAVATSDARAGDIVTFRFRTHSPAKHAAILSAPGRMIHAYGGRAVCETAVGPWWRRRIAGAFRFPARLFNEERQWPR